MLTHYQDSKTIGCDSHDLSTEYDKHELVHKPEWCIYLLKCYHCEHLVAY